VKTGASFKFLGTHITEDLKWTANTNMLVGKTQKRLYFHRTLRKVNLSQHLLLSNYRCTTESVLTYSILVWHGSSSAADRKAPQRIIKTASPTPTYQL